MLPLRPRRHGDGAGSLRGQAAIGRGGTLRGVSAVSIGADRARLRSI